MKLELRHATEREIIRDLVNAAMEAEMFLSAPKDSPRLWPVSRGNLHQLLTSAIEQGKSYLERTK